MMATPHLMSPEDFSAVPAALRERAQWLVWRLEDKPGAKKPAKMPYYASGTRRTGVQGSPEDRAALVTFDAAVARMSALRATGIGFAFLPGDGLIGIDLDKVVDAETGEIAPRALAIIEACASYTEWSPSGTGFHIYVLGKTHTAKDNGIGVEMFCERQFFTVTGKALAGTSAEVNAVDHRVIARLHKTIADAKRGAPAAASNVVPMPAAQPFSTRDKIRSALDALNPSTGYDEWLQIGMALHSELGDDGLALWDAWSARSEKYAGRQALEGHWRSFKGGAVKIGTLFHLAKQAGWQAPRALRPAQNSPAPSGASAIAPTGGEGDAPEKPAKSKGKAKEEKPIDWDRFNLLKNEFVLIYGTDAVYDRRYQLLMKVNALRLAMGSDYVKMWLNSPERQTIQLRDLVFEPAGRVKPGQVNMFAGLESTPVRGDVSPIIELLYHLCAESAESEQGIEAVVQWVLRWHALPLQRLGTKLRSALVFHGPQGAGKNLFFEIMTRIYGQYASVIGQPELESDYNDWASKKLFLIGDEVVARQELFHHKNKLKAFITGETIQVTAKFQPIRTEANHVNIVFLSNEIMPLALEEGDRRYLVVYTPERRQDDLYRRVQACLDNGGAQAFHDYLLRLDLDGFTEFDIPIMTRAKRDLIELGLKPAERFAREWLGGYLPLPLQVCSGGQLYRAARRWAGMTGERFLPIQEQFTKQVSKTVSSVSARLGKDPLLRYKPVRLVRPEGGQRFERVWIPSGCEPPAGTTEGEWATQCVAAFEQVLASFVGNSPGGGA